MHSDRRVLKNEKLHFTHRFFFCIFKMVLKINSDHFSEPKRKIQRYEFTERSCVASFEKSDFWNII